MLTCPNGHVLHSLEGRFCPECGATLGVSAGSAVPVPFCAVHAGVPAIRPCVRCGNFSCAQCLLVGEHWQEQCASCRARAGAVALPWDRREELGVFKAYWQTSTQLMMKPGVTFQNAAADGTVGSSLLYSGISSIVALVGTGIAYAIFGAAALAYFVGTRAPDAAPRGLTIAGIAGGAVIGLLIFAALAGVATTVVVSAIDQLVLRMVRAQPKSWTVTLRANALSLAPNLLGLIPFCGYYGAFVWAYVLKIFAYRAFHRTTYGKASLGALLVPGGLFILLMVGYAIIAVVALRAVK